MFQILIQMLHSIIFSNFSLFYKTNYGYYCYIFVTWCNFFDA